MTPEFGLLLDIAGAHGDGSHTRNDEKLKGVAIVTVGSPIWFGVRSAVAQPVIERLDGSYSDGDPVTGQTSLYGKVAGVIVTGNEAAPTTRPAPPASTSPTWAAWCRRTPAPTASATPSPARATS